MIETDRLLIRKFSPGDADDLFAYLSLEETYLFEPGGPISRTEAVALAGERSRGDDFHAVELKKEGRMIGHLYLHRVDPAEFLTWELGYIFHPGYQRRGFCTEASAALVRHAFSRFHAHKVAAFCNPDNPASWRVLEKIGMEREGFFKQKAFFRKDAAGRPMWHDCLAYGLLNPDRGGAGA